MPNGPRHRTLAWLNSRAPRLATALGQAHESLLGLVRLAPGQPERIASTPLGMSDNPHLLRSTLKLVRRITFC